MNFFKASYILPILLSYLVLSHIVSIAGSKADDSEKLIFIEQMIDNHGFDRLFLTRLFNQAEVKNSILKAIQAPSEAKPWYLYRKIFVTRSRVKKGLAFWRKNESVLAATAEKFGVPAEIIVAIIGVETQYGNYTGSYRVLDALFTLAFKYPKRSSFFRKELEQFLLLCREENLDPLVPKGSYAGAMGLPQFMPSSYRHYAVDFNKDKRRDIWKNESDTIASVANYFSKHGWQKGDPVIYPVEVSGEHYLSALGGGLKPDRTIQDLKNLGVRFPLNITPEKKARLLKLEELFGNSYWVGMHNFYVITRYNHSSLYAMAVYQLSQNILEKREKEKIPA